MKAEWHFFAASHGKKKNNFMAPFYRWGSTASRLEPLRGGSLLFTTKNGKNACDGVGGTIKRLAARASL